MKKKILKILSLCLLSFCIWGSESKAEELKDENPERLETVYGMDEEGNIFEIEDTPGIVEEGEEEGAATFALRKVAEPKVVNFNTKGNATTNYTEYGTGAAGYTNGAYGADAAYLGEEDGKVIFMLSGVVGKVKKSEVQVVDYSKVKMVSCYVVEDGSLKHRIAHKVTETSYSSLVYGPAPSYLKAGTKYYSYDGHYFYDDYAVMLADYEDSTRENSMNPKAPYYNYYQFLPMRSISNYTKADVKTFVNNKVTSSSKMRNQGEYFVGYQNTYGVNAILMTGIAANESAWGTSSICNNKNNLFGINAVDTSPSTSATTFASIKECIRQFSGIYMSRRYLNPNWTYYHGGFLGNKASGINVSYASDPYWGEKAANVAWTLDKMGGNKDYGTYTIGIKNVMATKKKADNVNVRNSSNTSSTVLYKTGAWTGYAVLLQKNAAENGFYKIQSDGVLNSGRTAINSSSGAYDFEKMYAYISDDYVTVVHKGSDVVFKELEKESETPDTGSSSTTPEPEVPKVTYTRYRTTTSVNYRSGAGTSYAKKGTLSQGTIIEVENGYSKSANGYTWVRFKLNGKNYYVANKYIEKYEVKRISGKDRYETAFEVADEYKKKLGVSKFSTVVVASGEDFADALSGSYLAGKKKAPMLLTNEATFDQLYTYLSKNLKAGGKVYILGGDNAVPTTLEDGLESYDVERLSGKTRYDTNLEILKEAGISGTKLLVSYGEKPFDSLSASAAGQPILLVNKTLTNEQIKYLKGQSKKQIYVLGGIAVISTELKKELKTYSTAIERISGKDRYETSVAFAKKFFSSTETAVFVYGEKFPDGLSGSSLAMGYGAPVILTKPQGQSVAATYVKEKKVTTGYVLGGSTFITDASVRTIFGMENYVNIPVI